ncbi:STAS domain-containing protein [Actinomadura sp. DC4]|uniref:STAS domain-containing protein n=1 Tax=Actinomadura sp. DC4 TaxID=3055069 RepID=UPI0025B0EE1E|nr:STAS domain-containing protein [Actinomadura sp. DC4]MDN3353617.1 STAS domain-containing protein [Actinomadura sp. DC4]
MELDIDSSVTDDDVVVLTIGGPMDVETSPRLRDSLVRLVDQGHHRFVLDLSRVDFIDSIGLGVLVGMVHRLRPYDGSLAVAAPSSQVSHVLQVTQLIRAVAVFDTADAAVSGVRDGGAVVSRARRSGEQASAG